MGADGQAAAAAPLGEGRALACLQARDQTRLARVDQGRQPIEIRRRDGGRAHQVRSGSRGRDGQHDGERCEHEPESGNAPAVEPGAEKGRHAHHRQ